MMFRPVPMLVIGLFAGSLMLTAVLAVGCNKLATPDVAKGDVDQLQAELAQLKAALLQAAEIRWRLAQQVEARQ